MNKLKEFANEVSRQRKLRDYTHEYAAELLLISDRWNQKVESGQGKPSFKLTCRICKLYGINCADYADI